MLEIHDISRAFGHVQALDHVSFTVAPGGMTGFIGGNGAGKTTTMRIVMGIIAADSGRVLNDGHPITPADIHTFGYMPAERGLYPKMAIAKQLTYFAEIKGTPKEAATRAAHDLLGRLGLSQRANEPVANLSLGNQQRVQIAASLVGDPKLLIMDEPFSGLDPIAVDAVGEILHDYADRGVPILFSSHQLDLVERLCDHLVIIAAGQIRAAGSREALLQAHAGRTYEITAGPLPWLSLTEHVVNVVPPTGVGESGATTRFSVDVGTDQQADDVAQTVLRRALSEAPVHGFGRWTPTLADVFREIIVDVTPSPSQAENDPAAQAATKPRRGLLARRLSTTHESETHR